MKVRLWPLYLTVICACNSSLSPGRFAAPPALIERVPFYLADGLILISGDVHGQHGYWLLDTGAPSLVINTAQVFLRTSIDRTTTVTDIYKGHSEQRLAQVPVFHWGPFTIREAGAIAMDLHSLEAVIHRTTPPSFADLPFLGILGIAQIEPFVTVLDYQAKQIVLVSLDSHGHPRVPVPGPVPTIQRKLVMIAGTPFVHAILQEEGKWVDALLAIDTGSDGGLSLDLGRVDRLGIAVSDRQGDTMYRSVGVHGDTISIKRGVLDAVFIGPVMYDTVSVTTRPDTGGTLGYRVLSANRIALNIRTQTLLLWN
jgi:hypothetical protein